MSEKIELTQEELEKRINEELEKKVQSEADKRVTQALKTAEEKHEEELRKVREEAVEQANMTAEELADIKKKELEEVKNREIEEVKGDLEQLKQEAKKKEFENKLLNSNVPEEVRKTLLNTVSLEKMDEFDPTPFAKAGGGQPVPKEPDKKEPADYTKAIEGISKYL